MAHMGEPKAEGRRRVAPCHPAARPLLLGVQAVAGDRLQPATAHPVRGRRREGAVRRVHGEGEGEGGGEGEGEGGG